MPSFNKVILMGRLTAAPEVKTTGSGLSVTSFSIAVDRRHTKGEEKAADFFNATAWRGTAEFICKYFKKGDPIIIWGSLQNRSFTDKQGNNRTVTEIVVDEACFVANKAAAQPVQGAETVGMVSYVPDAYASPTAPNFEDVGGDSDLPF
jgi:single-strand DNA-binding protein